jgi:hypothetical protein
MGKSLPSNQHATTSPTSKASILFHRKRRLPRRNDGSIDPEVTTIIGEGELDTIQTIQSILTTEHVTRNMKICENRRFELGRMIFGMIVESDHN